MTDDLITLSQQIKEWGIELGFQQIGIADLELSPHTQHLQQWLDNDFHGEMSYMQRHADLRAQPATLQAGALRVISARMDYLAADTQRIETLNTPSKAYISRYALGRDYHKLMRKRLSTLAKKIAAHATTQSYRAFVDSAPVLEKALAEKAGLGWIGKHTLLLNRQAGSWFFLGEILTDLPLPTDKSTTAHCGSCSACISCCPTDAIVAPYQLDSRRCISYLTIELKEAIPVEFRLPMGNRVFGCDDCQLFCPWNRYAQYSKEDDFSPRHQLDQMELIELFQWSEPQFLKNTEGSAIRRIGYQRWLRNIAIGLGNAPYNPRIEQILVAKRPSTDPMVQEHIDWALGQQQLKSAS
ncbi:MAG: tRNA epoxyqueuosine(34) reductase QueG [Pseudomonadales bacterium]|nr:tRNA epoxyqueuosine(34) reductase QueG [Pseudomonadales bacterium]